MTTPRRRLRVVVPLVTAVLAAAVAAPADAAPDAPAAPTAPTADDLIPVEIVAGRPADLPVAAAIAAAAGGEVHNEAGGVLLVRVPAATRSALADAVSGVVRDPQSVAVRPDSVAPAGRPAFGAITHAAVDVTNAAAWHAVGYDGTGVRIGLIDFFDVTAYWDPAEHGELPVAGVTARCLDAGADCTAELFDGFDAGGEQHGVAVAETIRDMAPGARLYLGQASTLSDYADLIDWFASEGVTVVNRSLGSRYDGPGDGRGPLDELVAGAVARGMVWVNSAGNNGRDKYYRHPVRLVGDRVAFGPSGASTFLPFRGCVALAGVRWAGDWDVPPELRTDYDAYLWESPIGDPGAGRIVASSLLDQHRGAPPLEHLTEARCPVADTTALYLEVRWRGGDVAGDVLEVLDYGDGIATFTQAAGSAAVPVVDSADPGVLAVGAVDPPDSGVVAWYSSQGPTNDGRITPDLVAPAGLANTVIDPFAGTSAAAAVATGAVALLFDAGLGVVPSGVADLARHLTIDRGVTGIDPAAGAGELRLPAPPDPAGVDASPSRFVPLAVPTRVLDTRPESPIGPAALIGRLARGEILDLPVTGVAGVPADGVTAVAVNLVTVHPDRPSYLQAVPTLQAAIADYSNLNADAPGQVRANFAILPVGEGGAISIYSIARGDVVVDVLGWFEQAPDPVAGGRFVELATPQRLLDSRVDAPVAPLASLGSRPVPMPAGLDAGQVGALVVTVTATGASAPGWVQAYPADRPDVIGTTSTVNVLTGGTVANTAIVPVGGDGIALAAFFADDGAADVIVDAIGYVTSPDAPVAAGGRFLPVRPARALDSRAALGAVGDRQVVAVDASDAPGVAVPGSATAVVWNLAIVGADRPGFLRTWAADRPEPATSSLNWVTPGETRAGAVISAVDDGRMLIRVEDGDADLPTPVGHVLADVFGYFT